MSDLLTYSPLLSESQSNLNSLFEWQAQFSEAARANLHRFSPDAQTDVLFQIRAQEAFCQALQAPNSTRITVGNTQFDVEKVTLTLLDEGIIINPSNLRLASTFIQREMFLEYSSRTRNKRMVSNRKQDDFAPMILVHLPSNFILDGVALDGRLGWVQDAGYFIFHSDQI